MMAEIRLGLRLARLAGAARMATVVTCTALGVALVVLIAHFPQSAYQRTTWVSPQDRAVLQVLGLAVIIPVLVMVATLSRLSSDTRDRRLATLRLLGLPPLRTALVAVAETLALVGTGALIGVTIACALLRPIGAMLLTPGWIQSIPDFNPTIALLVAFAVVAGASVAAGRPAMRSGRTILQTARTPITDSWRGHLAALIAVLGLGLAGVLAFRTFDDGQRQQPRLMYLVGVALVMLAIGVISLTGQVIRGVAALLSRRGTATGTVCAARLRGDRANISRALAGLVMATFVSAIGLSVFAAWTGTPQYVSTAWANTHRTSVLAGVTSGTTSAAADAVRDWDGVQDVAEVALFYDQAGAQVVSASCAQIREWAAAPGCSDNQPWVVSTPRSDGPVAARSISVTANGLHVTVRPTRTVAVDDHLPANSWGIPWLRSGTTVVPPDQLAHLGLRPNAVLMDLAPGSRSTDHLMANAPFRFSGEIPMDWVAFDQVRAMRHLTLVLVGSVIAVGLLGVVIATLDLLTERRHRLAAMRMIGVPVSVLGRAQFGAVLIPLLAGLGMATAAGWLVGRGYLNVYGQLALLPVTDLTILIVVMSVLGVGLAAATVTGMGKPLSADLIRRE